jgi:hypothetical protein
MRAPSVLASSSPRPPLIRPDVHLEPHEIKHLRVRCPFFFFFVLCCRVCSTSDASIFSTPSRFRHRQSPSGTLSIAGFGSLLSVRSARSTFPTLENFRAATVEGYRRVFAHTCPIFYERGIVVGNQSSSLSTEPHPASRLVVSVFEVPATDRDIEAFVEREIEFRFTVVEARDLQAREGGDGGAAASPSSTLALMCTRYSDEEFRSVRCKGSAEEFHRRFGRHGIDRIYRDDILPCRVYLRHCVLASQTLGPAAHASFLDDTYLADRRTTIREYLARDPAIMNEQPPESLKERYNG